MTAGMHLPVVGRAVVEIVLLVEVEGVEIGPEADMPRSVAGFERPHHAGACQSAMDLGAERVEQSRDHLGGPGFLEGRLRVRMNVAPPAGHVGLPVRDPVDDGHGPSRLCQSGAWHDDGINGPGDHRIEIES